MHCPARQSTYEPPAVRDVHAEEVADGVVLIVYVSVRASARWAAHRCGWNTGVVCEFGGTKARRCPPNSRR